MKTRPPDDAAGAPPHEAKPAAGQGDAPAVIEIEDVIDLHGFQPRDIPSVVEEYVLAAAQKGYREVRLIHGRGTGFQRNRVREVLAASSIVERFADAPPSRGGWGATIVWLRPDSHRG
jgi:dsDNA-specific endonuclease/ATPase MutS2